MKHALLLSILLASSSVTADATKDPLIVTAPVTLVTQLSAGLQVTVGAGTKYGITMAATCAFVDGKSKVVSTDCTMVRVREAVTIVSSKSLQMDDVKAAPTVMFTTRR